MKLHALQQWCANLGYDKEQVICAQTKGDISNGFIINQTAANAMGFENPIGHELTMWGRRGTIIGVSNDFHFSALHNNIEPLIFFIPELQNINSRCNALSMKIKPNSKPHSLKYIKYWGPTLRM